MMFVWLLVAATTCYLAIVVLLAANQTRLIYPAPSAEGVPPGYSPVALHTADGLAITAGYRPARVGLPTVLLFHGNGMVWPDGIHVIDLLASRGYGVLLAEYRGYNGNPGEPNEDGLYHDGRAALAFLQGEGVASGDVVLAGLSVGSGPAVQLATENKVRALILISPVASLPATVNAAYPWLPPAGWLLRDRYDNLAKLPRVDAPVLIMHGDADRLIPHAHAEQLVAAHPGAEFVSVPGRGHNMAADPLVQRLQLEFLERLDRLRAARGPDNIRGWPLGGSTG
jgi:pimeloyl-ACP methyl ester carboxylesterase